MSAPPARRIPIIQGEHAVVREPDAIISTLLGSCIAVCLHDAEARIGGMNHFLLGEPQADQLLRDVAALLAWASEHGHRLDRFGTHESGLDDVFRALSRDA